MENNSLTTSPAPAANNQTKPRKSAAGRTLIRWSPDLDQQLLLALEAVVTEDEVKLDWNSVGEQMPQIMTGEAIKQHLAKVRTAREKVGMPVVVKAEKKGVFGSRRGIVRRPPKDQNAPTPEKKVRGAQGIPSGTQFVDEEENVIVDDFEYAADKEAMGKTAQTGLLYGPAIPGYKKQDTPRVILKLPAKRKAEEESEDGDEIVVAPKKTNQPLKKEKLEPAAERPKRPRTRVQKPEIKSEDKSEIQSEVKAPRAKRAKSRADLDSNFKAQTEAIERQELERKQAELGNSAAKESEVKEPIETVKKAKTVKKSKKSASTVVETNDEEPILPQRSLRAKSNKPNYRDGALSDDDLSDDDYFETMAVAGDSKDDEYEPEMTSALKPEPSDVGSDIVVASRRKPSVDQKPEVIVQPSAPTQPPLSVQPPIPAQQTALHGLPIPIINERQPLDDDDEIRVAHPSHTFSADDEIRVAHPLDTFSARVHIEQPSFQPSTTIPQNPYLSFQPTPTYPQVSNSGLSTSANIPQQHNSFQQGPSTPQSQNPGFSTASNTSQSQHTAFPTGPAVPQHQNSVFSRSSSFAQDRQAPQHQNSVFPRSPSFAQDRLVPQHQNSVFSRSPSLAQDQLTGFPMTSTNLETQHDGFRPGPSDTLNQYAENSGDGDYELYPNAESDAWVDSNTPRNSIPSNIIPSFENSAHGLTNSAPAETRTAVQDPQEAAAAAQYQPPPFVREHLQFLERLYGYESQLGIRDGGMVYDGSVSVADYESYIASSAGIWSS